jgi:hypothetical protein
LERVAVDTTVQPKAVAHPTHARLMHRAQCEAGPISIDPAKTAVIVVDMYVYRPYLGRFETEPPGNLFNDERVGK